jgi:hypothetical protein
MLLSKPGGYEVTIKVTIIGTSVLSMSVSSMEVFHLRENDDKNCKDTLPTLLPSWL